MTIKNTLHRNTALAFYMDKNSIKKNAAIGAFGATATVFGAALAVLYFAMKQDYKCSAIGASMVTAAVIGSTFIISAISAFIGSAKGKDTAKGKREDTSKISDMFYGGFAGVSNLNGFALLYNVAVEPGVECKKAPSVA